MSSMSVHRITGLTLKRPLPYPGILVNPFNLDYSCMVFTKHFVLFIVCICSTGHACLLCSNAVVHDIQQVHTVSYDRSIVEHHKFSVLDTRVVSLCGGKLHSPFRQR